MFVHPVQDVVSVDPKPTQLEFKVWPKTIRVENRRPPVFTEKLDGTNSCIVIHSDGTLSHVQSRNRIITPSADNYGFAKWVEENEQELLKLGQGYHYGEWWGQGIRRGGYGLKERRFSLFDAKRWGEHNPNTPACCHVVPIIPVITVEEVKAYLAEHGSLAAPGFKNPEGAIMFDPDTKTNFKIITSESK